MKRTDYLSEFEQEFELDNDLEFDASGSSNDSEQDWEYESDAGEFQDEFEDDESDSEEEEYEGEYENDEWSDMPEREYENRLYEAYSSGMNNEFEMEQAVDRVFYEMEQDFFFGKLKKMGQRFLRSAGGQLVKRIASKTPFGTAISALSKAARGDIRGALKGVLNNDMLKHAVSFMPGGSLVSKGMDIAGKYMNNETPAVSRAAVGRAVRIAKGAYGQLADDMTRIRSVDQLKGLGKKAVQQTASRMRNSNRKGKNKTSIPLAPGAIVTVHPTHINIWQ